MNKNKLILSVGILNFLLPFGFIYNIIFLSIALIFIAKEELQKIKIDGLIKLFLCAILFLLAVKGFISLNLVISIFVLYLLLKRQMYVGIGILLIFLETSLSQNLISYFYNRALEEANGEPVDENEFRYPGPKPQFKEAALVMLADSIEAAARSFDEPTAARLQKLVKDIIQAKFLDGQLEECNLTLRDLSIIENAFEHVLLGMYHQRIDYPGQKQKEVDMAKKEVKKGKAELRLQENVSTKKSS